ncbi:MAG: penicillin acylase family protein [Actinomycetota bacterium]|nr:penicillin acylase family protein [Actinomycetota bacterium]
MLRLRRIAVVVAVVLVLVLVLGAGASYWFVQRSFPKTDGVVQVPGLSDDTRVVRDRYGVPQIYADNAEDLFYAQGYVQAQDRFFQMDFRRHVTEGRLAELFGRKALRTDMFVRSMAWHEVAEEEFALLDAETRDYLEAFSDGVNAYLEGRGMSRLSLEYTVLGMGGLNYAPEEWTPVDSLAWLKAVAWDLRSNMHDEVARSLASSVLSRGEVSELYPAYPVRRHAPVVGTGAVADGVFRQNPSTDSERRPARAAFSPAAVDALAGVRRTAAELPRLLGTGAGIGSNAWAVSGRRTNTGQPLLANDPHLAPSMPGVWYQMGLHCTEVSPRCPFDVSGFTFAGLPGVVVGHNRRIAWGMTNLSADVTDLYIERVRGDTYEYAGRRLPLQTRRETFRVAGGRPVTMTVRSTRHGPLVSDVDERLRRVGALGARQLPADQRTALQDDTQLAVALRWTALEPSRTADALFGINTARNWQQFRAAARSFAVPTQNLVYADVDGHIGYQAPGRIPVRRTGSGDWPVPGWDPAYEWAGYVPFDALPHVLDPAKGYIVSANQQVAGPSYPYDLGDPGSYGYRSDRLAGLIEGELSMTIEEMARMQLDSRNGNAATLVPYLLDLDIEQRYVRQGQRVLEDWDLHQPAGSAGAAFFNVVWRNLLARTFHDQLPRAVWPDGSDRWFEVVRNLLRDPQSHWWDDVRTENVEETRDDMLTGAMIDARYEITRRQARDPALWTWGHVHQLKLVHESLGRSGNAMVEGLFNRGPYELGGGDSVVNATGWTAPRGYAVDWVPSMRMVVSLGDLDESRWVNLTGASGHAFHPHYNDQFELWRDGETAPWPFTRAAVAAAAEEELRLVPKRREVAGDGLG